MNLGVVAVNSLMIRIDFIRPIRPPSKIIMNLLLRLVNLILARIKIILILTNRIILSRRLIPHATILSKRSTTLPVLRTLRLYLPTDPQSQRTKSISNSEMDHRDNERPSSALGIARTEVLGVVVDHEGSSRCRRRFDRVFRVCRRRLLFVRPLRLLWG